MRTWKFVYAFLILVAESNLSENRRVLPAYNSYYYNNNQYWKYEANDSRVAAYDRGSQVCCSGKVYPFSANSYGECCGFEFYDVTRQKCCDGKVFDLKLGYYCCGNQYFSTKTAKCCNSPFTGVATLIQFPEEFLGNSDAIQKAQCCGLKIINTRRQICCSKAVPVQGQRIYDHYERPRREYIAYDRKFKNTGCCNGNVYDRNSNSCVGGEEHRFETRYPYITSRPRPYTRPYYNQYPYTQSYYYQYPRPRSCNTEIYDMRSKVCCTVYKRTNFTSISESKLNDKKTPTTGCCGLETYDYNKEICCNNNKIHEQNEDGTRACCGNNSYNTIKESCCEISEIVTDKSKFPANADRCCGDEKLPYNSQMQKCCGNKVLDIPRDNSTTNRWNRRSRYNDYYCCWDKETNSEPTLFQPFSELCCGGVKYGVNSRNRGGCCGKDVVNWREQLCCKGKLFNKSSNMEQCCGNRVYNSQKQLCCDYESSIIIDKVTGRESCCGKQSYDSQNEICCRTNPSYHSSGYMSDVHSAVFVRTSPSMFCCGLTPMNPATHRCCGTTPIDKQIEICCSYREGRNGFYKSIAVPKITPNARCCGKDVYDPLNGRCCNMTVVQGGVGQQLICCGSTVFDPAQQLCCDGHVYDLGSESNLRCCGPNAFNSAKQICCRGAVKDIKDPESSNTCCYEDEI